MEEWIVEVDQDIVERLRLSLRDDEWAEQSGDGRFSLLLDRFRGLRVEIFSNEHPPPHFHITCGNESAIFSIADCSVIGGTIRAKTGITRAWHSANKDRL